MIHMMSYKATQILVDLKSMVKRERTEIIAELRSWEREAKLLRKSERFRKLNRVGSILEDCVRWTPGFSINDPILKRKHNVLKRQYIVRYQKMDFVLDIREKSIAIRCSSSMEGLFRRGESFDTHAKKNRKRVPISETDGAEQIAPKIFARIELLYNLESTAEVVDG